MVGAFANNDIVHIDDSGADHDSFSYGLKKSLLNYMHGAMFDMPLHKWFDFKVPKTSVAPDYIAKVLEEEEYSSAKPTAKVVYLGKKPTLEITTKSKKGSTWEVASLTFETKKETLNIKTDKEQGTWLAGMLEQLSIANPKTLTLHDVKTTYEAAGLPDFELFWDNKPVSGLYKAGLLVL